MRRGFEVEVFEIPPCDMCKHRPAAYDAKTIFRPWANLCERCFANYGIGLGVGRGQRLLLKVKA